MGLSVKLKGFEKTIPSKAPDKNPKTIAVTHEQDCILSSRIIMQVEIR